MVREGGMERLSIRLDPEMKAWLDKMIEDRVWASYSHAFRWLVYSFSKEYEKKPFKVRWFKGV